MRLIQHLFFYLHVLFAFYILLGYCCGGSSVCLGEKPLSQKMHVAVVPSNPLLRMSALAVKNAFIVALAWIPLQQGSIDGSVGSCRSTKNINSQVNDWDIHKEGEM